MEAKCSTLLAVGMAFTTSRFSSNGIRAFRVSDGSTWLIVEAMGAFLTTPHAVVLVKVSFARVMEYLVTRITSKHASPIFWTRTSIRAGFITWMADAPHITILGYWTALNTEGAVTYRFTFLTLMSPTSSATAETLLVTSPAQSWTLLVNSKSRSTNTNHKSMTDATVTASIEYFKYVPPYPISTLQFPTQPPSSSALAQERHSVQYGPQHPSVEHSELQIDPLRRHFSSNELLEV
jgi:hypothetical protein